MSRFASIRAQPTAANLEKPEATPASQSGRAEARVGKKAISGYLGPEISRALRATALERNISLQALMGEAFADLMRKYGKHPVGER